MGCKDCMRCTDGTGCKKGRERLAKALAKKAEKQPDYGSEEKKDKKAKKKNKKDKKDKAAKKKRKD